MRIFISFYVVFLCLTISNLVYGKGGLVQYNELKEYREKLVDNIAELENSKSRLERNLYSVQTNGDYLVLAAREIGYFKQNQGVIRFGYPLGNIENNNYGHIIPVREFTKIDKTHQHLFIIFAGLLTFLLATLFFREKNDH